LINHPYAKELEKSFYTAQTSALVHLQTTSEWSFSEETMNNELPMTLVGMADKMESWNIQENLTILLRTQDLEKNQLKIFFPDPVFKVRLQGFLGYSTNIGSGVKRYCPGL